MATRDALARIKASTVAFAIVPERPPRDPKATPFTILGSGLCIDAAGIVVTCEHVLSGFMETKVREAIAAIPEGQRSDEVVPLELRVIRPAVIFYRDDGTGENLLVLQTNVTTAVAKTDYDLGVVRLAPHGAFAKGFPYLELEDYRAVHEGMEVATCGFPLGDALHDQLGTRTSSFTRGILSSIVPTAWAQPDLVDGFQLDLTATHGNSGGPVFSWESGKVFGVLQKGAVNAKGEILPGIARAESLYKLLRDGTLDRLKSAAPPGR